MIEAQMVYINGKARKCVIIRGREYVRKGYDLPATVAGVFEKKCDLFGEDESKIVEKLITCFTEATGWDDDRVKQTGSIYDHSGCSHIKEATKKTIRNLFPWVREN